MKLPGVGEVKHKNLLIGGTIGGVLVIYLYMRRKKAASAASGNDGSAVDPNAIDPATGIPYGEETGYGGYYMGSTVAPPYVSQSGTATVSGQSYTNNLAWESDAVQYASSYFNASAALIASATGKYLDQTPVGLSPDEYTLISEIVGLIGPPPNGSFRLIAAAPSANPPAGNPPPIGGGGGTGGGTRVYVSNGTLSLNGVADAYGSTPAKILAATTPIEPVDVAGYLRLTGLTYTHVLPVGTKWFIPS